MKEQKCVYMPGLTWPEFKECLPKIKMAIIPVGSFEQHGPHGRFPMDAVCAGEYAKKIGERLYPYAAVTPTIPLGVSGHHMNFPGTLTLKQETLLSVLMDVTASLRKHGIRRFLFANGHGGNTPVLQIVTAKLRQEFGDRACYILAASAGASHVVKKHVKSSTFGHACEIEISTLLYLAPETVKTDALSAGDILPEMLERSKSPLNEAVWWDENTTNGCLGDARLASVEIGEEIVQASLERIIPALKVFMEKDVD